MANRFQQPRFLHPPLCQPGFSGNFSQSAHHDVEPAKPNHHPAESPAPGRGIDQGGTWVFGYGSLIWNPGFPFTERRQAVMAGYHRAYKIYSTRNRGMPDAPGMVVSLAPGRSCTGMIFRIEEGREADAFAYLDQREGVDRAHRRVRMPVFPPGDGRGHPINAWTYLPILTYCNYIWGVPAWRKAELVARGHGKTGTSLEYLRLMLQELARMDVAEPELERLLQEAQRLQAANGGLPEGAGTEVGVPHMDNLKV